MRSRKMQSPNNQKGETNVYDSGSHVKTATVTETNVFKNVLMLLFCTLAGIIFGFASEKGRGMICFSVLSLLPIRFVQKSFSEAATSYELVLAQKNAVSIGLGAFILGVGMTLAGSCPGMVLPQVGAWAHHAIFTLIGALIGSLVYGLAHDWIYERIFPSNTLLLPSASFPKWTGFRYAFVTFPMAIVVFVVVIVLELLVDWQDDAALHRYHNETPFVKEIGSQLVQTAPSIFQLVAWPPSVCGTLIGLMQVVIVLAACDTLGGSSSYCTVTSQLICTRSLREQFPYMAKFQTGIQNWWQVLYVIGAVFGGMLSSILSKTIGDVQGVPVIYAVLGGFCLLMGARIAGGCTSGHGLSGSGLLLLGSFLAVPCMFAGAIISAFILLAVGQLDNLY